MSTLRTHPAVGEGEWWEKPVAWAIGMMVGVPFICLIHVLMVPVSLYHGWVLQKLWSWFVVPLGMPSLNLLYASGLVVMVRYLAHQMDTDVQDKKRVKASILGGLIGPLLTLFTGWLLRWLLEGR